MKNTLLRKEAQQAMQENGIKVFQNKMVILEYASHKEDMYGTTIEIVDYVMFKDLKTDKQWQCNYGHFNFKLKTLWQVREYDEYYEYIHSAESGDYSPSNPWGAPGMSIHDFF